MNKTQEALKLSLKALEDGQPDDPYPHSLESKAITAIREALAEQPPCQYPHCPYPCPDLPDCRDAEQPAQQQEPVAVVKALPMGHNQPDMHYAECQHLPVGTPLYTSPPASKQWVGLTDEEYSSLHDGLYQQGKSLGWVVDQIEAKLREKNA